jgi:hypothetical protein
MAERPVQAGAEKRSRSKVAIAAAALFPLLVSAGVFAPGLVQLALQVGGAMSGEAPGDAPPSAFEHRPLPAPRDPALVFTPVALELDRLFFESHFRGAKPPADGGLVARGPAPAEGSEPLSFPRHDAEAIVLDEACAPEEVVFKDALIPEQEPELALLDQGSLFLGLCPTIPSLDCLRPDDFTRVLPNAQVPEPASAVLLGLGLALLAALRRRS